jgi:hypothetical protein
MAQELGYDQGWEEEQIQAYHKTAAGYLPNTNPG